MSDSVNQVVTRQFNSPSVSMNSFERISEICAGFRRAWDGGRPELGDWLSKADDDGQSVLLRNLLEIEIRCRRRIGETPSAAEYVALFPASERMIRRVFFDTSSVSSAADNDIDLDSTIIPVPAASRLGEYRLLREIGRGGMGAVFEAVHLSRGHRVALKTLPAVSAEALHRFKREFRGLADVTHPNLIGLRTLECDGAQWFITLDLLEGVGFLDYVRSGNQPDEGRLRAALAQLVAGVMALHARGVIHRDLKPGNVMVTSSGRVVILDFGLVSELKGDLRSAAGVAGTPAYMAPEQAAGQSVGPAADWYAVGVMLYEALSGRRPFEAKDQWQLLAIKQREDAPALSGIAPTDLADLAMRLLARDPAARPDPLYIAGVTVTAVPAAGMVEHSGQLVARETQLAALNDALVTVHGSHEPVTAFVRGRSGEGKTSLVEAFLAPLRHDPTIVVLAGRCYDRESVPFKALDTLVDALTGYLRTRDAVHVAQMLPDDIGLLAELFPVLRRCDVVASAPKRRLDALEQQQVRQRAFAALRLLLERLGERSTVVCFVDDLQWGDTDSAAALFEVLRPPHAPPILFVGSYRSDEADASPFLTEWVYRQRQNCVDMGDRTVVVGPLSLDEAARLVANVVGRDDEVVRRRAIQFHTQTGGNPFLLTELAGCFDPDTDAFHATDIHGVLANKLADLPPDAGPLLRAVAVSGQAVDLREAAAAGGLTNDPDGTLTRMRNVRLLRVVGAKVDTYHDRVRYAVLDRLNECEKNEMHGRLAEEIEKVDGGLSFDQVADLVAGRREPGSDKQLARAYDLSYHFDAAGNRDKALAYSLTAAAQARAQFVNDVAAQQYAIADRNAANSPVTVRYRIARRRGEALMQLGRYELTEREIDIAAALANCPYDVADTLGMRGEMASKRGLIAESIAHYESGLRTLGVHVPRTRVGLWWGIAKEIVIQTYHSIFPFRLHHGSLNAQIDLSNHLLARVEWSLYAHSVPKLLWASMVGLNRAQQLPKSKTLAINYVVHANDMAVLGWHSRAEIYYERAIELSNELNDLWGAALGVSHFGFGCAGAARFEAAVEKGESGLKAFSKLGDMFEIHLSLSTMIMGQYGLGQLRSAYESAKTMFDSCIRHEDNILGPWAAFALVRCAGGRVPFDELFACVQLLPGNTLAASPAAMAEGYWHAHHGRTAEAVSAFERSWQLCLTNLYIVNLNSSALTDLVTALRRHTAGLPPGDDRMRTRKRWHKMAKWADRLSWFLPPERPRALRELALMHADRGRIHKAWKLAAKSCHVAESQKAKYEYAQSLRVQGELGKQLGKPEADEQLRTAQAEIDRIEGELAASLNGQCREITSLNVPTVS